MKRVTSTNASIPLESDLEYIWGTRQQHSTTIAAVHHPPPHPTSQKFPAARVPTTALVATTTYHRLPGISEERQGRTAALQRHRRAHFTAEVHPSERTNHEMSSKEPASARISSGMMHSPPTWCRSCSPRCVSLSDSPRVWTVYVVEANNIHIVDNEAAEHKHNNH